MEEGRVKQEEEEKTGLNKEESRKERKKTGRGGEKGERRKEETVVEDIHIKST